MTISDVGFPREIMIEATNICNNKCFFCGSTISDRKRGIIDSSLMERLIAEAYDLGARVISFHGMGEPCICKELASFVKLSKLTGYEYIYLDTNGVLATPEVINPVIDAGLDSLKFSIHAACAETYKKITNNDAFALVFENFKSVSEYICEMKYPCKLISYFAESIINQDEKKAFEQKFAPYASDIWIRPIHNGSGVKTDNISYAVTKKINAMTGLPCKEIYNRMIINWEGYAIACSTDWTGKLIYGDANMSSLSELWNCEQIKRIRWEHEEYNRLNEICRTCIGGCE